jgi:TolB protein
MATPALSQNNAPHPSHHASAATISPDGRRIAFFSDRDGTGDYYIMNADGSGVRRVTTDGGHRGRAYWDRQGRALLFSRTTRDTTVILTIPVEGGTAREIGRIAGRAGALPVGDGTRVLYGAGDWAHMQLVTSRLDGSDRKALTADSAAAFWCPAFSPRGNLVVANRNDARGMQIWIMNLDGSGARAVTRFDRTQGNPQCPSMSADGRWIAAQAEVNMPGDTTKTVGTIWVIDLSTGAAARLAPHAEPYHDELPVWFPDGKKILFQSDRSGRWELYAVNTDGSGVARLTQP